MLAGSGAVSAQSTDATLSGLTNSRGVIIPASTDPDGVRSGALALNAASAVDNPQYYDDRSLDRANDDAVDYYSFTTDARYQLGLGIRGQSINLDVCLEDADGNMLIQSWPPPGNTSHEWIRTTLDAGTYYVRVVATDIGYTDYYVRFGLTSDPDGVWSGAVTLDAASAVDNPQYYYNKSLDRANHDAVDYYSFTLDARYRLGLGIRGQSINLDVYLEDANGNMLKPSFPPSGSPSDEWIQRMLDAGTYYVRVVAMENGYTDYYVRFGLTSPAPDGVWSGAVQLHAEAAVDNPQYYYNKSLDRANGDAVDYYRFRTFVPYELGLGIRGQSINLDVYLEDANRNVIIQSWPPPGGPSDEWIRTTLDAGTYYVRVVAMENGYTDYYVRFGVTAPDPDGMRSGTVTLDAEAASNEIKPSYYDSLDRANHDAVDYYSFTLDARSFIRLTIERQSIHLDMYLEDADGNVIIQSEPFHGIEFLSTTLNAGTYYVRVVAMEDGYTDYKLNFSVFRE